MNLRLLFLPLILILTIPLVLMAQTGTEINWEDLGIDTGIIVIIIGFVQFIKAKFLETVKPIIPYLFTVIAAMIIGVVKNWGADIESLLQVGFGYAFAATWLYEGAKSVKKSINKG